MSGPIQVAVTGTMDDQGNITGTATGKGPAVTPPPPSGGGMYKPTSVADLVSWATKLLTTGGYGIIDPSTPAFNVPAPIVIPITYGGGSQFGIDFSCLDLNWTGGLDATKDCITFDTSSAPAGTPIRGLIMKNLSVYGGGYEGKQCGRGIVFRCPGGGRPIYRGSINNMQGTYCNNAGMAVLGDFFESSLYDMKSENNLGDGMQISDVVGGGGQNGVISNLMMYGTNLSRNRGYGLNMPDQANSVDMFGGSFINNGSGGVFAASGIRQMIGVNGENTGLSLINIPGSSFGTNLVGCNMSSDGATIAPGGKVSRYVLNSNGVMTKIQNNFAWTTPYGSSTQPSMAVNAPAGTPWK